MYRSRAIIPLTQTQRQKYLPMNNRSVEHAKINVAEEIEKTLGIPYSFVAFPS